MFTRTTLAAVFLLLAPHALAQTSLRSRLRPITGAVKDAGVLDLATGTWTRRANGIGLTTGLEIVYSNTCSTGYYAGWEQGWTIQDEGAIPNSLLPSVPSGSVAGGYDQNPGCADRYEVNGFEIGYCTYQPTFTTSIRFYDQYETMGTFCAAPGVPIADFALSGLPGSPSAGVSTCWTVTIDLATTPAGGFALTGTGGPATKIFGWSLTIEGPSTDLLPDGPIIAGGPGSPSPSLCTGTDATRWDNGTASISWPANRGSSGGGVVANEEGTGMLNLDAYRVFHPSIILDPSNCFWFGGDPRASFHLELYSDTPVGGCTPPDPGSAYCFGDGTTASACPCGNSGAAGAGCDNSAATGGGRLSASGSPSLSNDNVTLSQSGELPTALSVFLQGTSDAATGVVFGDGVRCASGNLLRLYVKSASQGIVVAPATGSDSPVSVRSAALGDPLAPGFTRYYGVYYRDPAPSFCPDPPGNTWNIGNGYQITWSM